MKKILKVILLYVLAISSAHSAVMELTAKFSPSLLSPENNKFTNTTPLGGFCLKRPTWCISSRIEFSVSLPIDLKRSYDIPAKNAPRDGVFFKYPKYTKVNVIAENGSSHELTFNITAFNFTYSKVYEANDIGWVRGEFYWGTPTCRSTNLAARSDPYWYEFAWYNSGNECIKQSNILRTGDDIEKLYDQSIAYELITPNPLEMESGIYRGQVKFTVGPGGDIDYGDNYQPSDRELIINFTLTVNHELKVTPLPGGTDIVLYPCYQGIKCEQKDSEKNWERWIVTNIPPQKLSGLSKFNISSSGSFTVYMACGSGPSISLDSCPIISDKSSTVVPVKAMITLPNNIANKDGQRVISQSIFTEKDLSRNQFFTSSFGKDQPGQIAFTIEKKNITKMLKSRPDSWSGNVTIIFDPNLY
ncbi:hypothetical protein WIA93_24565 [Citrobacter amalonaticus]|uniref:hypothetical protein n=1 Tax=Citrobacter amalonaticus TaxID=35703 RepID=UPI00339CD15F